MLEKILRRFGLTFTAVADEQVRLAGIEVEREQTKRAEAEDALVAARSTTPLTATEQVAVIGAHLSAVRAQSARMAAAHG